ncbi:hypothetical protein Purlil1_12698 [Purpureocillium lilacinum]|uniref:Uncharacterized protein n=1 Tax=Purpureocillium lilacinum TaxID=33203 RepID=A0ABR0BGD4_PURLI|nr:hypothetical protein Purlil1_12698 [Purpureocillium lilacinum]
MASRPTNQRVESSSSSSSSVSWISDPGVATEVPSSRSSRPSVRVTAPQPEAFVEYLRCMRCARSVDMMSTDDASAAGMVRIGLNLYYCNWTTLLAGRTPAAAVWTTMAREPPAAAATTAKLAMRVLSEMSRFAASCRVPESAGGDLGLSPWTCAPSHVDILTSAGRTVTKRWQLVDWPGQGRQASKQRRLVPSVEVVVGVNVFSAFDKTTRTRERTAWKFCRGSDTFDTLPLRGPDTPVAAIIPLSGRLENLSSSGNVEASLGSMEQYIVRICAVSMLSRGIVGRSVLCIDVSATAVACSRSRKFNTA